MRLPLVVVSVPSVAVSDRIVVTTDFHNVVAVSAQRRPLVVAMTGVVPRSIAIRTRVASVIEPHGLPFVVAWEKPWPLAVEIDELPEPAREMVVFRTIAMLRLGDGSDRSRQSDGE